MPTLPRVIIISIPNSPRRAHIQAVFNNIGLPFEFHDAVNGKELSPEILAKVDQDYARHEWGQTLTKGEIGCAASHIQVYEKIISQGLSEAIILEDDAQPSEDFIQNLQELFLALPKRAEIAFLHHGKAKSWPFKQNLANGKKLVRYRYPSAKSR